MDSDDFELDEDERKPAKPLSAERRKEIDELLSTISEIAAEIFS